MKTNHIVLASRPKGIPALENFNTKGFELAEIKDDEVLYFSVDPYMRGRMNDAKSYAPPFEIVKPMTSGVFAKVIKSKSNNFKENDIVTGNFPWQQHCTVRATSLLKTNTSIAPASYYSCINAGFIGNYQSQFDEGSMQLTTWVKGGKLKHKETIVKGFDKLPTALLGLFEGDNIGKMIVEV
jgi:NADPH-dependent curcumin reductase CurA